MEIHFLLPAKVKENVEALKRIIKVNKDSLDGEAFQNKIKDINTYVSYERRLANTRLSAVSLLY